MSHHEAVRLHLQHRLAALVQTTGKIERDLRLALDRDSTERATETENDEVLAGLDAMTLKEARQIRNTLKRIDEGRYGLCTACGQRISDARLAALPTTETCARCAHQ